MTTLDVMTPDPAPAADRPAAPEPLLVRRAQAAGLLGISLPTLDRLSAAGKLPAPVRLGGTVAWSADELRQWTAHGCPPRKEWGPQWDAIRRRAAR